MVILIMTCRFTVPPSNTELPSVRDERVSDLEADHSPVEPKVVSLDSRRTSTAVEDEQQERYAHTLC